MEDNKTVVTSDPVKILVVEPAPSAASSFSAGPETLQASASGSGITYFCSHSGAWHDASTWGGQGVPDRYDTAVIPVENWF